MAKVLLFQCENEAAIRQILIPMKIKALTIPKQKFHMTLGELESGFVDEGYFGGAYPEGSLLVMCDFTEKQMNRFLMELRSRHISVDYKAVLTPINRNWDVSRVYFEMQREKAMIARSYGTRRRLR